MAEQTSHYGLIKPTYDEHADVEVLNENMDTIDEQIYAANTSVRTVSRGGTGAATAAEARTNLGLGDVLDDISNLENSLGALKTSTINIAAGQPTVLTFSSYIGVAILIEAASTAHMCILIVHCSGAGNITLVQLGDAPSITTAKETNKLTITNSSTSTTAHAMIIRITSTGNMPT